MTFLDIATAPSCVSCHLEYLLHWHCEKFYRNVWDPSVTSDRSTGACPQYEPSSSPKVRAGFMQKRYSNGTFFFNNPIDCSPQDKNDTRACSLQSNNQNGFYESSSWEYSWWGMVNIALDHAKWLIEYLQVCTAWHCASDQVNGRECEFSYLSE